MQFNSQFKGEVQLVELRNYNERRVLEAENQRLKGLLERKDELIQELTCKLIEFRSLQERCQQGVMNKLQATRKENTKLRNDKHKQKTTSQTAESLLWFKSALHQQTSRTKSQYQQSLQLLQLKQHQDMKHLQQNYQTLRKAHQHQLSQLREILGEKEAVLGQVKGSLAKAEARCRQLELESEGVRRELGRRVEELRQRVAGLEREVEGLKERNGGLGEELREGRGRWGREREGLEQKIQALEQTIKQLKQKAEQDINQQKKLYSDLQEKYILRQRNIQLFGRNALNQKHQPQFPSAPTPIPSTLSKYQQYIQQLHKSLLLKQQKIHQLSTTLTEYRKYISLETPCESRCQSVEQTGTSVKSLYDNFRKSLKQRLK